MRGTSSPEKGQRRMSRKLAAAIAAGALGAGLLLGAVGVALAGDRPPGGMMGTGGAGQVCDASHMRSHMTAAQMNQMMGGSMDELMDDMMGTGPHQQHHATQP
jgi:hypothetical protein